MFKVSIQLTDSLKNLLKETAKQLKGGAKRKFIAQTVVALGHGGQLKAEQCKFPYHYDYKFSRIGKII